MKKWIITGVVAIALVICGFLFIPRNESRTVVDDLKDAFKSSITSFEEASLETIFTLDDEIVYSETIEVTKTDEGSNYVCTLIELSDSLLDEEMYKTTTSEGSYSKEETIALFGGVVSLKKSVISNIKEEQDDDIEVISFTIFNKNIDKAFGTELSTSISGDVNIEVRIYDGEVELYTIQYITVDNIEVLIRGAFIM